MYSPNGTSRILTYLPTLPSGSTRTAVLRGARRRLRGVLADEHRPARPGASAYEPRPRRDRPPDRSRRCSRPRRPGRRVGTPAGDPLFRREPRAGADEHAGLDERDAHRVARGPGPGGVRGRAAQRDSSAPAQHDGEGTERAVTAIASGPRCRPRRARSRPQPHAAGRGQAEDRGVPPLRRAPVQRPRATERGPGAHPLHRHPHARHDPPRRPRPGAVPYAPQAAPRGVPPGGPQRARPGRDDEQAGADRGESASRARPAGSRRRTPSRARPPRARSAR